MVIIKDFIGNSIELGDFLLFNLGQNEPSLGRVVKMAINYNNIKYISVLTYDGWSVHVSPIWRYDKTIKISKELAEAKYSETFNRISRF